MTTDITGSQTSGDHDAVAGHIAQLWKRLLNRDDITRDAHFIEFGGDSLLLLSIMAELEETYDVELDVDEFVENLTVGGMATAVVGARLQ